MLYNIELKKEQTLIDCFTCKYFDKILLKCNGLNKCCFEYDKVTGTCIDGITKLPIKIKEN